MAGDPIELLGWRRRMFELYREVRASHDPEEAWELWRDVRDELFATHPQSPVPEEDRKDFTGLAYFDYDLGARTVAVVHRVKRETLEMTGSAGSAYEMVRFGVARFELYGQARELEVYWIDVYGGGVFLPFRDATSGRTTYGGGRYLLDTVKGADLGGAPGELLLDFNFAYNPSCSYDPKWVCPLAPLANRLNVPIRAGERYDARKPE